MLTNSKVLFVEFTHLAHHIINQRLTESNQLGCLICEILQLKGNLCLEFKDSTLQSYLICRRTSLIHAEELKISAEIEDIELVLILAIHKSVATASSATDHLPELRLTHHFFEEDKIQNFGHVNTCIKHIDGNRDLR